MARRGNDNDHLKSGQLCRQGQYRIQYTKNFFQNTLETILFKWTFLLKNLEIDHTHVSM